MITKMRRFKIDNGCATINKDGEFLHINDVLLMIIEKRQSVQGMLDVIDPKIDDDWSKKRRSVYNWQIDLLNEFENEVRRIE